MIDLVCGDVMRVLPEYPAETFDACFCDPPYGLGFMGKAWDHGVPSVEVWREVWRILKPGAFLLAFSGTRTWHRLACAIEDAGFEVRDTLMWLYGSGFPKSLDISKAIDKAAGKEREVVGRKERTGGMNPSNEGWKRPWQLDAQAREAKLVITEPATDAARLWSGYGTALKPAWEPILVAMKPCEGTFAENALKWGVAGLGIDASRIGTNDTITQSGQKETTACHEGYDRANRTMFKTDKPKERSGPADPHGRWPANLLLDEEAAEGHEWSRYFYCAKASCKERGEGNTHPTVKPLALCEYLARLLLPPDSGSPRLLLNPFAGSGSEAIGAERAGWDLIVSVEIDAAYVEMARRRIVAKEGAA